MTCPWLHRSRAVPGTFALSGPKGFDRLSPNGLGRGRCLAADFEKRVRQRDGLHVARQPGVDHEGNRPLPLLTRLKGVLLEAETLELVEMRRGLVRGIARYRLRRHASVLRVLEFVHDGREFTGVHLHRTARG